MTPKPYLNADELAGLTPWTKGAIAHMVRTGLLQEGVHFFRIYGPGRHRPRVFKWAAIVELIESKVPLQPPAPPLAAHPRQGTKVDVGAATDEFARLLH